MSDKPKIGDLDFDPGLEAERITGKSYKADKATDSLSVFLHLAHSNEKRARLQETNDTHWGISFNDAVGIFLSEGFDLVLMENFTARRYEQQTADTFVIMAHRGDGLLLLADSSEKRLNRASVHYNALIPREGARCYGLGSSSPWHPEGRAFLPGEYDLPIPTLISGNFDVKEGFRERLATARTMDLQSPWIVNGMYYIGHHGTFPPRGINDPKPDFNGASRRYVRQLPPGVVKMFKLDERWPV